MEYFLAFFYFYTFSLFLHHFFTFLQFSDFLVVGGLGESGLPPHIFTFLQFFRGHPGRCFFLFF